MLNIIFVMVVIIVSIVIIVTGRVTFQKNVALRAMSTIGAGSREYPSDQYNITYVT